MTSEVAVPDPLIPLALGLWWGAPWSKVLNLKDRGEGVKVAIYPSVLDPLT